MITFYLSQKSITAADIIIFCTLTQLPVRKLFSNLPNIAKWYNSMSSNSHTKV